MGTDFDDFRSLAHRGNDLISKEAQRNRLLLVVALRTARTEKLSDHFPSAGTGAGSTLKKLMINTLKIVETI